jgi:hypothetical protein
MASTRWLPAYRQTRVGVVVACVLPDRILYITFLDNKSVGSSLASHVLTDASTGTVLFKLGLQSHPLCAGTYKCATAFASEYSKARAALCFIEFRVDAPEMINVSVRAPGPVAVGPTCWLTRSDLLANLWTVWPPHLIRFDIIAVFRCRRLLWYGGLNGIQAKIRDNPM